MTDPDEFVGSDLDCWWFLIFSWARTEIRGGTRTVLVFTHDLVFKSEHFGVRVWIHRGPGTIRGTTPDFVESSTVRGSASEFFLNSDQIAGSSRISCWMQNSWYIPDRLCGEFATTLGPNEAVHSERVIWVWSRRYSERRRWRAHRTRKEENDRCPAKEVNWFSEKLSWILRILLYSQIRTQPAYLKLDLSNIWYLILCCIN